MEIMEGHKYKFSHYCSQRNIISAQANFKRGIEYLTQYFYTGAGYSSVNTARSVLSSILESENGTSFMEYPLVCRLLNGVFKLRPPYHAIPLLGMSQYALDT